MKPHQVKMQKRQIELAINTLEAVGINISKDGNPYNVWKFILRFSIYISLDITVGMVSITNIDNFHKFVTPIPYIGGSVIVQGGSYFIYHYRKLISVLLYQMDENFYTYPDEQSIQVEYPWYLQEKNIVSLITLTKYASMSVLIVCLPVLGELIYYGRIKTYLYPIWTPWSMDSLIAQVSVSSFQFIQGYCGLWFNYVNMIFLFVVVTEFMRQYQRLMAAVRSLESRTVEQSGSENGVCFNRELRKNIIHCIEHHQILLKSFRLFKIWFSMVFSIELAIAAVNFTFATFLGMKISNLSQVINYFPVVCFIWATFLIRCLVSEIFPNLNENLAEAILWDAPWYKVNKDNQRLLRMFHSIACQPMRLYGLSVFEATRVTFGKLVRMTYSFFNVLSHKNY